MSSQFPFKFRPRVKTTAIVIHSSHTKPEVETVEDYLRVYGREMGLLEIGYHYVIERSGRTVCVREPGVLGSHTPGHNWYSIGICLSGGRNQETGLQEDNFLPVQLRAAAMLVDHLLGTFGELRVVGHTEIQRYRNREMRCPEFDMSDFRARLSMSHRGPDA